MKKLVVVAPTFNEAENIEAFITNVLAQQIRIPDHKLEILISDSHSKDKTPEIVKQMARRNNAVHYLDVKKRGLGLGLIKGLDFAASRLAANYLITMEADLSNDPNQIPEFVKKLEKCDLVIGSRYANGGKIVNWSLWRKAFSLGANFLLKILAWTDKTSEFTNLYRAFTKEHWLKIKPEIENYFDWIFVPAFAFESLDKGIKISELPIVYYDRFGGRSKMHTMSYTKNLLRYALKFRLQKIWNTF